MMKTIQVQVELCVCDVMYINEPVGEKANNLGSDQVQNKPWLEVGNFGFRKEVLYSSCSENKGTDQLHSYCEADMHLCFRICRLLVFPCGGLPGI